MPTISIAASEIALVSAVTRNASRATSDDEAASEVSLQEDAQQRQPVEGCRYQAEQEGDQPVGAAPKPNCCKTACPCVLITRSIHCCAAFVFLL